MIGLIAASCCLLPSLGLIWAVLPSLAGRSGLGSDVLGRTGLGLDGPLAGPLAGPSCAYVGLHWAGGGSHLGLSRCLLGRGCFSTTVLAIGYMYGTRTTSLLLKGIVYIFFFFLKFAEEYCY